MSFAILASNSTGAVSFSCATASQAVDKVLELEQQHFKNITVKDGVGRAIDLDELSLAVRSRRRSELGAQQA